MRLGLDLLFLIPGETGGRETYARELISALFERDPGLSATAFVNRQAQPELQRSLGANLAVVALPVSARSPQQWAWGELARLPRAASAARVDLLHSLANFAPVSGRFRRVITVHDLQYRAVPELLTWPRRVGTAAMINLAARRARRIIAVSAFTERELVSELGLPADRIDVIPNGIGLPIGPALPEEELRRRFTLDDRPIALTVATALPHKNLPLMIDAVAAIRADRRPVLVLCGAGTDGASLRDSARDAGIAADVRLLGFQPSDVLEGLYRLAACVVIPSRYEGFGLPALEAMVRGRPLACADIPALREVTGGAALWFSPTQASDIAGAITRLIEDPNLAERLSDAGRQRAAAYSWDRTAEATLSCYRRALEAAPARL